MRALWLVGAIVIVVACRSAPKPEPISNATPKPLEVELDVDDVLLQRLATGLPLELEMKLDDVPVGTCTLSFDLWDEVYRVALSRSDVARVADRTLALRRCVDMRLLHGVSGTAMVSVGEAPAKMPIYTPPDYPTF